MLDKNYYRIIKLAFPIVLANASVPLLGLADTAAIGHTGSAVDLGAIALSSLVFNFVYWGFGFLRQGTTGFIAQSVGAKDKDEVEAIVFRSILLGLLIGVLLVCLQKIIGIGALHLMSASDEIKILVEQYFYIRIWGAPATLITFSILGTLIGMGWTKDLLFIQLFLNGLNVLLNIVFVVGLNMGVEGIALGTVLSEVFTLFLALFLLFKRMDLKSPLQRCKVLFNRIVERGKLIALFRVNGDIMIRTLALLSGFAWFANQGAKFGDEVLAANHVLLQFVSLSAFFLDGYAHVGEMLTGQAYGARNKTLFLREVKQSTVLAGLTSVVLASIIWMFSDVFISLLTVDKEVRALASQHSGFAAVYVLFSFVAFQLDGVFIGVTRSREMRNATLIALSVFISSGLLLTIYYGNAGLWIAFIGYVICRALALGAYYPAIIRDITQR
ncbi:MATE family efflux transporter [Sphingobacterium sp. UT-1RO-CII-1]|uniref:MATE family efflux transporter n=1 Tax=Sphingobacterium sp. UT-1RO-CII-1 TaxID=2995225 RepID=UPI00227B3F30|nr:MATE family efflux transporter [Sphingobacterium sp. UT-1RO-CII-1]MCY4780155.1 MATE family efflux transporter [Sphingobacterium sp. UT-1RO-CII-1]